MRNRLIVYIFIVFCAWNGYAHLTYAAPEDIEKLQNQINTTTNTIKQLEEEISKFEKELQKTSSEANTLKSAVTTLDTSSKKLSTNISITQNKIEATNLTLTSIQQQISDKQARLNVSQKALATALRAIYHTEDQTFLENLINNPHMSTVWDNVESLQKFQTTLQTHIDELNGIRRDLLASENQTKKEKKTLVELTEELADQRKSVELAKEEKSKLLKDTKNQESAYKKLIADKKAKADQFNKEILEFEKQLKFALDPSKIPTAGQKVLSWPIDKLRITQTFGDTAFSRGRANPYNGKGHNGIDLAASVGTPLKAAADGTVTATGNTDDACPNASYGKWILIKHTNGLSTLYAHMSSIKAPVGANVARGEVVGFSGMTGYATGPHLHLTVLASQGVQIQSHPSRACNGRIYTIPAANPSAYLDPMLYF
jgi:murein DD-endopeptidase MepM/ murein hydrolase activator NlpD